MLKLACGRDSVELQASYDTPGSNVTVLTIDNLLLAHHPSTGRTGSCPGCRSSGMLSCGCRCTQNFPCSRSHHETMHLPTPPTPLTAAYPGTGGHQFLPQDPLLAPRPVNVQPCPLGSAWSQCISCLHALCGAGCGCSGQTSCSCCQGSWT